MYLSTFLLISIISVKHYKQNFSDITFAICSLIIGMLCKKYTKNIKYLTTLTESIATILCNFRELALSISKAVLFITVIPELVEGGYHPATASGFFNAGWGVCCAVGPLLAHK